jgi:DNA topoisomerase-2
MNNKEIVDLMTVLGLKIGEPVKNINNIRFGKIVSLTDQDSDGQHIFGLLCALIKKYWPELFEMGAVYKFITPLVKVLVGKNEMFFYTQAEFKEWQINNPKTKFTSRYLKGLGSSTAKDFKQYFRDMDKHLIKVTIDDISDLDIVDLVFGKESGAADRRKVWLDLEQK